LLLWSFGYDKVEFQSEFIEDTISSMTDFDINGKFTKVVAQEVLTRLNKVKKLKITKEFFHTFKDSTMDIIKEIV